MYIRMSETGEEQTDEKWEDLVLAGLLLFNLWKTSGVKMIYYNPTWCSDIWNSLSYLKNKGSNILSQKFLKLVATTSKK